MSTTANVTVALAVASGGAILAWAGIVDPPGGIAGAIQRLTNGQPIAPTKAPSDVLSYAPALFAGQGQAPATATPTGTTTAGGGSALVAEARKHLGAPYLWGGAGPDRFDCSGLVFYCYKRLGVTVPRVASLQQRAGAVVAEGSAQAGDLVFFGMPAWHVGIVTGPGRMIAAPKAGDVVKEQSYEWGRPFGISFRRIPAQGTGSTSGMV